MTSAARASPATATRKTKAIRDARRRRNPKSQVPNPKEIPSTKLQGWLRTKVLRFGASLELGAWDLKLPPPRLRRRRWGHGGWRRRRRWFIEIELHFRRSLRAGGG